MYTQPFPELILLCFAVEPSTLNSILLCFSVQQSAQDSILCVFQYSKVHKLAFFCVFQYRKVHKITFYCVFQYSKLHKITFCCVLQYNKVHKIAFFRNDAISFKSQIQKFVFPLFVVFEVLSCTRPTSLSNITPYRLSVNSCHSFTNTVKCRTAFDTPDMLPFLYLISLFFVAVQPDCCYQYVNPSDPSVREETAVCEGAKLSYGCLSVLSSWVEKWEGCLR